MSRTRIIIAGISLLIVGSILSWIIHVHLKIERLMEMAGPDPTLSEFIPTVTGETNWVDLGYAEIQIPNSIPRTPFRHPQTIFLILGDSKSDQRSPNIFFYSPLNTKWQEAQDVLDSLNQLPNQPTLDWFASQKRIFRSARFGIWDSLKNGLDWTAQETMFFTLKQVLFYQIDSFEIYENERIGFYLARGPGETRMNIIHKETGREISLKSHLDAETNRRIGSALIKSYRPLGEWDSMDDIIQLMDDSGIPLLEEPPSPPKPAGIPSEEERLQAVIDEVKNRRALRQKSLDAVPVE